MPTEPTERRSPRASRFYTRIGKNGWRDSAYFTFSVRSPALRRWIAAQLPAKRKRILSVGCGTGELESHLTQLQHEVVGLDLSRPMLKRGRDRGLKLLVQADSQSLPFGPGSFDVVLFMECVGYLPLPAVFAEARRVLRRHGRLLLTSYSGDVKVHAPYTKFEVAEIAAALAAAGFRVTARRFLSAKRSTVVEVPSDDTSTLLYVSSTKTPAA
jgi:SAM-dependent methyltransferase